jgi:ferredoxin
LIHPGLGSYFFLAALLTDITFESDSPFVSDHCGTCQACLDACPTEAFPKPYVLDARKCISYLTIEHRGAIPAQLRAAMQDWVFGCDVCQQVCPWNRKPHPEVPAPLQLREENRSLRLSAILRMNEREFRERFRRKAVWRTKWRGMLRNAMISTANAGLREMKPLLRRFLFDGDEVLRETAAWVINQVQDATPTMNRTARLAGYAAAEAVLRTSEAFGLRPMIFWEDGVERRYDVQFGDDVANGPLTTALQWLEYNPEGAVRCALTYESCLDLENCASQAIIVEVREYTDGRTMEMSLAIPYRTGEGPQGFGVHSPEWLSGTWDSIDVESFFEEFFAGFEQHEEGTLVWASSFLDRLDDV